MVSLISPSIARSLLAVFDFSRSSYLPLTTLIALGKKPNVWKPKYIVKKKALITSNIKQMVLHQKLQKRQYLKQSLKMAEMPYQFFDLNPIPAFRRIGKSQGWDVA